MSPTQSHPLVTFIGGGNMAAALIGGLIADGWPAARLRAVDPDPARRELLQARFGVRADAAAAAALDGAAVVVLAVKPQVLPQVARELGAASLDALVVSIAAGIRTADLRRWLGARVPVVRAMPNTPALVQSGITALFAADGVTESQRELAESILRAVGITIWLADEALMDAVTAVSGSGPAYFFLIMEALQAAAEAAGLEPEQARLLTLQTAFGAAKLALESTEDVAELRRRVTSPGGTTERALAVLEDGGVRRLLAQAVEAARKRSAELAEELGRG